MDRSNSTQRLQDRQAHGKEQRGLEQLSELVECLENGSLRITVFGARRQAR
jgi:hypothetical protein